MQSALFSLQERKAEQLHIRREGKQIAHSSQNKLLPGEAEQLEPIQPDTEVRAPKTDPGLGSRPLAGRDLLSKWWPPALISPLLPSVYAHEGEPASSFVIGGGNPGWKGRKKGSKLLNLPGKRAPVMWQALGRHWWDMGHACAQLLGVGTVMVMSEMRNRAQ